jgi:hypothetical protein
MLDTEYGVGRNLERGDVSYAYFVRFARGSLAVAADASAIWPISCTESVAATELQSLCLSMARRMWMKESPLHEGGASCIPRLASAVAASASVSALREVK